MASHTYLTRRGELQTYFDRTAVDAWSKLTSDAPLGRIRATVRAGRDRMRDTLLTWLPDDLTERRVLDAGCGTGALSVAAAKRGANVTAIDLSPTLVGLAGERSATLFEPPGQIDFQVGDMLSPALGNFDHVVAMDSLIHYRASDMVNALLALTPRVNHSILFTFAPCTPSLTAMHAFGRLLPRGDRAPAIEPVTASHLKHLLLAQPDFADWQITNDCRISSGFYISQAWQLTRRRH